MRHNRNTDNVQTSGASNKGGPQDMGPTQSEPKG